MSTAASLPDPDEGSDAPAVPDETAVSDGAAVPDEAVRLALELAFGVAVLGARQRPPLPVPAGLRPFLRFQKLPPAALGPLRRAVESDDAFRSRIAAVADESVVGRAGALWLRRPPGWEAELAALAPAADDDPAGKRARMEAARVERAERAAARAVAEAGVLAETLTAERERQAAELATTRAGIEAAQREAAARAEAAERAASAAALAREVAERRLVDADRSRAAAERRADELAARVAALEADRAALAERLAAADAAAAEAATRPTTVTPPVAPPVAPSPAGDDVARRLAPIVADAGAALGELARVLGRLGAELDGRPAPTRRPGPPPPRPPAPPPPAPGGHTTTPRPRPAGPFRSPAALPPHLRADAPEAAVFLLRRPGAVVLVDGYNVAKVAFPGARTLADERDWLADVLDELAARLCGDVRVVFDGADVPPVPSRRRAVQVQFSPAGVTADDVLVELVNTIPADRPVVVATNDLALRERVKIYGANVVSAEQLLAAARR